MSPSLLAFAIDRSGASVERLTMLHAASREQGPLTPSAKVTGVVALATCHRLELYTEGAHPRTAAAIFRAWLGRHRAIEPFVVRTDAEAARHLMRVAAGLESAALGEHEILGQLRAAYRAACATHLSGALLHRLFHTAFRTGRRVRAETTLGAGVRSLPAAAVATLGRRLGGLSGCHVLVLGAGEMAAASARLLRERGVNRVLVANRTMARARALAAVVSGVAVPWEWRAGLLERVDAAICATSAPEPVLPHDMLAHVTRQRQAPLYVADLGVPANVERCDASGVHVLNLDVIAKALARGHDTRTQAIEAATRIVEDELASWLEWRDLRTEFMRSASGGS